MAVRWLNCPSHSNSQVAAFRVCRKRSRQFTFHLIICRSLGKCARAIGGIDMDETDTAGRGSGQSDQKDLATFGYKQELHRTLGFFISFAAAFSYISPSTGIFALFALGLTTIGGVFIWSWPIVAIGQLIIALGWAELSSHYPVAGSVFQWTKYLSGKTYSWFAGWIYLFAGTLTVASVCATLPHALIPAFNSMGWILAQSQSNQRLVAVIALLAITVLNIFGV